MIFTGVRLVNPLVAFVFVKDLISGARDRMADMPYAFYMLFVPEYTATVKEEGELYLDIGIPELDEWEQKLYTLPKRTVMFDESLGKQVFGEFSHVPLTGTPVMSNVDGVPFGILRFDDFVRLVSVSIM
jgi:hypothetical protein